MTVNGGYSGVDLSFSCEFSSDPCDPLFAEEPPPCLTTKPSARWGQEPGIATPREIAATVRTGKRVLKGDLEYTLGCRPSQ